MEGGGSSGGRVDGDTGGDVVGEGGVAVSLEGGYVVEETERGGYSVEGEMWLSVVATKAAVGVKVGGGVCEERVLGGDDDEGSGGTGSSGNEGFRLPAGGIISIARDAAVGVVVTGERRASLRVLPRTAKRLALEEWTKGPPTVECVGSTEGEDPECEGRLGRGGGEAGAGRLMERLWIGAVSLSPAAFAMRGRFGFSASMPDEEVRIS